VAETFTLSLDKLTCPDDPNKADAFNVQTFRSAITNAIAKGLTVTTALRSSDVEIVLLTFVTTTTTDVGVNFKITVPAGIEKDQKLCRIDLHYSSLSSSCF
jgi:hypothetical protein